MEYEGNGVHMYGARQPAAVTEGSSSLDEEAIWQMNLRGSEPMESGPYPERPWEPDCAYYIRTGLCRFGMTCKFNHPPNRKMITFDKQKEGINL
ncbi:putative zinc finger CCCH domain-containing protein ZFN-like [Cocos nucifera]|uniref:Putative zinc finger CCCH domain-containing protein ZFN-like n=1 Tax=Cocos nucifera TaxID=13894 RepID=A0A8K0I0Y0_COCNU|nr:putative zinc finger CCCH domain-containing protein ZFN-like [Cocos nucifera]